MILRQSILRYMQLGLLVCYAGFVYGLNEGCNEKQEQLLGQPENLNKVASSKEDLKRSIKTNRRAREFNVDKMEKECRSWSPWSECDASIEQVKDSDNRLNSDREEYLKLKSMIENQNKKAEAFGFVENIRQKEMRNLEGSIGCQLEMREKSVDMMKKECRSWWPWNKCNASIENFKYFDNNLNSDWKKYFKLKSMNLK